MTANLLRKSLLTVTIAAALAASAIPFSGTASARPYSHHRHYGGGSHHGHHYGGGSHHGHHHGGGSRHGHHHGGGSHHGHHSGHRR